MKTRFFIAVAMLCLVSFSASAQDGNNRRQRFDRAEMIQRYADRLAQQMSLSEEKSSAFKVLFMDYQMARQNAANPKGENEQESIDMQKLTDEQAGELVQKHFAAQEAQLKVDKEYYPKFLEILTPAQAAQVFVPQRGMGQRGRNGGRNGGGRQGGGNGNFGGGF